MRVARRSGSPPGGGRDHAAEPGPLTSITPSALREELTHDASVVACGRRCGGGGSAGRGERGSSRAAPGSRRPSSGRIGPARGAPWPHDQRAADRVGVPARYLVVEASPRRRPARAAAGPRGSRRCCRRRRGRRRRARRPPGCRLRSAAGWWASRPRPASSRAAARRRPRRVGLVDQVVLEPPAREHLVDEPVGPAVEVGRDDHVVPGAADRGDQGVRRGHPAGERRGVPALELAERALERRAGDSRSASSRSPRRTPRGGLDVGRGLVDRGDDAAVARIGVEAGVDRARREAGVVGKVRGATWRGTRPGRRG